MSEYHSAFLTFCSRDQFLLSFQILIFKYSMYISYVHMYVVHTHTNLWI